MLDLLDRESLIASLPKGGIVAEIGVASGLFSEVILKRCFPTRLYLIDPWLHQPEDVCGGDPANHPQHVMDAEYEQVVKKFAQDPVTVIRMFSVDAAEEFPDDYFGWCFIDANHLQARQDAEAWWPKVKPGGYLLGHDYTNAGDYITVKADIDAWVAENGLTIQVAGLESEDVYERNYPSFIVRKP